MYGRTDGRTDVRMDGISPHSTGLRPLSGPLPKKRERMTITGKGMTTITVKIFTRVPMKRSRISQYVRGRQRRGTCCHQRSICSLEDHRKSLKEMSCYTSPAFTRALRRHLGYLLKMERSFAVPAAERLDHKRHEADVVALARLKMLRDLCRLHLFQSGARP